MRSSQILAELGWSNHFLGQINLAELDSLRPARVAEVHRDRLSVIAPDIPASLVLPPGLTTGDVAVGDWVLCEPVQGRVARVLQRKSKIARRAAGEVAREQLIAANVDTAFLTTSCNADFNEARIERYLALILQGAIAPVVLLTKADMCADPGFYVDRLHAVAPDIPVIPLNALDPGASASLSDWCRTGQTVCFLGSSGVGKSTLANMLTGLTLDTGAIRDDDAKGRHTTTARTLHPIPQGGMLIDTPGMRELRLSDVSAGLEATFADLAALAAHCRFADCSHDSEPGCTVQAAIEAGRIDPHRLVRWKKLQREDRWNTASAADLRASSRRFGRMTRDITKKKHRRWLD